MGHRSCLVTNWTIYRRCTHFVTSVIRPNVCRENVAERYVDEKFSTGSWVTWVTGYMCHRSRRSEWSWITWVMGYMGHRSHRSDGSWVTWVTGYMGHRSHRSDRSWMTWVTGYMGHRSHWSEWSWIMWVMVITVDLWYQVWQRSTKAVASCLPDRLNRCLTIPSV